MEGQKVEPPRRNILDEGDELVAACQLGADVIAFSKRGVIYRLSIAKVLTGTTGNLQIQRLN